MILAKAEVHAHVCYVCTCNDRLQYIYMTHDYLILQCYHMSWRWSSTMKRLYCKLEKSNYINIFFCYNKLTLYMTSLCTINKKYCTYVYLRENFIRDRLLLNTALLLRDTVIVGAVSRTPSTQECWVQYASL